MRRRATAERSQCGHCQPAVRQQEDDDMAVRHQDDSVAVRHKDDDVAVRHEDDDVAVRGMAAESLDGSGATPEVTDAAHIAQRCLQWLWQWKAVWG